jgi:hypothetical protein
MKDHIEFIVARYPRLFHGAEPLAGGTVASGWLEIIDELCGDIDRMLTDEQAQLFEVRQIKEKFGTLRFSCGLSDAQDGLHDAAIQRVRARVAEASVRSTTTCYSCGGAGSLRHQAWMLVLCDACQERSQHGHLWN